MKQKENCIEVGCQEDGSCEHHFVMNKKKEFVCIACGKKLED